MEPPVTIDLDELIIKSPKKVCLIIEGDKYWFDRDEVEIDEEELTIEMPYKLAREKGFI